MENGINKNEIEINSLKTDLQSEVEECENNIKIIENEIVIKSDNNLNENNSSFINALSDNSTAVELAQKAYQNISNQEKIAKKIEKVAKDNTNADIEQVEVKVFEKDVNNKVKRQQLKNDLLKLQKEKLFIKREENHKLKIQKLIQRREKYGELLTRHNKIRKDEYGNIQINLPNGFVLFFLIIFDAVIQFLNMISEVFGKLNKAFIKGFLIILILLFVFVSPLRNWIFSLIGINWGN